MSNFSASFDLSPMIAHLRSIGHPSARVVIRLEQALLQAFEQSQQDVHVITGSLRGSGRTHSNFDGSIWEGTIEYGGDSPGFVNDPVVYSQYERARGGDHDFLANIPPILDAGVQAAFGMIG